MAERYTRLFALDSKQQSSCPVFISKGALLYDNQKKRILAQLKYINLSSKSIKAMTVSLQAFDGNGTKIESIEAFLYEGISAGKDDFFGDKTPIVFPDNNTKSFSIDVLKVSFSDGTSWNKYEQQFIESAQAVGGQVTEAAKIAGNIAGKTTSRVIKIACLLVNAIVTFLIALATFYGIQSFKPTPKGIIGITSSILATIVSFPGFHRIIFRGKSGLKYRVLRWFIFAAIILIDLLLVWIIL